MTSRLYHLVKTIGYLIQCPQAAPGLEGYRAWVRKQLERSLMSEGEKNLLMYIWVIEVRETTQIFFVQRQHFV